jgi:transposase-like protein/transposase
MPNHVSDDLKLRAVQHYLANFTYSDTARTFMVPQTSLKRWVDRYNQHGNVSRKQREYVSYKVRRTHVTSAIKELRKQQTISMKELSEKLKSKHKDFDVTPQWLGHVLRDNNETRKRTRHKHEPKTRFKKPIDMKKEAEAFYSEVKKHKLEDIICLDEYSVSPFMIKTYSRCKLGWRCVKKTYDNIVFRKFTLLLAVSTKGVVGWKLYKEDGANTERLEEFLKEHITTKMKGKLIIMDNAGAHKNDTIRNIINNSGNKILYSIPYNPRSNAIENVFSEMKHYLSTGETRNFDELEKSIENTLHKKIPPKNFKSYFKFAYDKTSFELKKNKSTRERTPPVYKP